MSVLDSIIKISVMIIMFLMIIICGSIPLTSKAFKENKLVLAIAGGFSGGLFLSVGLIHLLPEANVSFENYFESIGSDKE